MKKNLTELVFILDRSGSMSGLEGDTIGGYNSMLEKQKKEEGEAYVTTVLFDTEYEVLCDHVAINEVNPLTNREYFPRGCTALLDAVGTTINRIGERLSKTPEEERPENVVIVITTDGEENSSVEFNGPQVKKMIEHQQKKYAWTFIFLGANINAEETGKNLGIKKGNARTYTNSSAGLQSVYSAVSKSMSAVRKMGAGNKACAEKAVLEALDEVE